jgi:glucosamine--fructose-6-phosphate aminotransferase (isomerizing)
MCGIVGYVGAREAADILVEGLRRLEYRGYDSAGVAVARGSELALRRSVGKISALEKTLASSPVRGTTGVGHTRWATHGRPSEENAHPHRDCNGRLVVVHNGIIENHRALREELVKAGHRMASETDSEVVAHLVESLDHGDLPAAVRGAIARLHGVYALCVLSADHPDRVVIARNGPPLVVGMGEGETFIASDIPAVLNHTRDFVFLEDGDLGVVTAAGVSLTDAAGRPKVIAPVRVSWDPIMAEKSGYRHFMQKEIHEQPRALADTLRGRVFDGGVDLEGMDLSADFLSGVDRCVMTACGTSWHAALVGQFLVEELAGIPVTVDYGSEFRYRDPLVGPRTLAVAITQSGETADTLAAVRECRRKGARVVSICNVVGSQVTRESDGVVYTHAGPEIGVASTKAFTTQLASLALLALWLGARRGRLAPGKTQEILDRLRAIPSQVEELLGQEKAIEELAALFHGCTDLLYLGRGVHYPIALEGALKLKEISYIHAEGYPAGEMKHGPIALIDEKMPVVIIVPDGPVFAKTMANLEEVKARGGIVIALSDRQDEALREKCDHLVPFPATHHLLSPILSVVPLQLLAYHVAVLKGTDVDQPRNLAKSVTVE